MALLYHNTNIAEEEVRIFKIYVGSHASWFKCSFPLGISVRMLAFERMLKIVPGECGEFEEETLIC